MTGRSPTRHRSLLAVLAAECVSLVGTRVSHIALPWLVLTTTGSVTKTGLVAACEMAPYVLVKALSGPVIDHVGPRRVSIGADLASAAAIGLVPLTSAAGWLDLWVLCVGVAVVGGLRGPGDAAKEVFLPEVADVSGISLERVAGLSGTIERLSGTLGPAVGGLLVAWLGSLTTLMVTAVAFAAGGLLIKAASVGTAHVPELEPAPYLARLREGFDFLRSERLLRAIIGMIAVTNLLDAAMFAVLLPAWALATGHGPAAIGLLSGATSLCAVGGSVLAAMYAERLRRRWTYLVGFSLGGAPRFVVLALDLPLPVQVGVFGLSGLGLGFVNPVVGAIFFERVPRHMLGRANTLGDAASWSGIPLGGLVGAAAITLAGLSPAFLAAGIIYLLTTTIPALRPEWHDMNRRHHDLSHVRTP